MQLPYIHIHTCMHTHMHIHMPIKIDCNTHQQISCPTNNTSIHYLYFDNTHSSLTAIVSTGADEFYFLQMGRTGGDCTASPLQLQSGSIVTAATYDSNNQVCFFLCASSMCYYYSCCCYCSHCSYHCCYYYRYHCCHHQIVIVFVITFTHDE